MRFFILLALGASLVFPASRKLPPEFEPAARMALSSPPEFAADALLRLVESGKISDREAQTGLIEQAFDLAAHAHLRVKMRALSGTPADTRSGSLAKAYNLKLDAVSVQARAIRAMLPIDGAKARQMFAASVKPELPPLTCDDSLVYDPGAYYQALATVVAGGFTAKEKAEEDHVAFLLQYVAEVHTAAQLQPMAAALKSAGLTPQQQEAVVARFNGRLESISGDDRSFSASVNDLSASIAPAMSASFLKYTDKHLGATRCEENVKITAQFGGTEGAKTEGTAKVERYWQSDTAQRLMAGARTLRFGGESQKVLSDSERSAPEWQQKLADYEKDLEAWTPASEKSEADYYHQKCIVYEALVELIPPGPERDKALQSFIGFVNGSNLQAQSPVEWFVPAQAMLERVRNTNNGEPAKVLAAFEGSGNPVLALYAALERTFERTMPSWVTAAASSSP